MSARFALVEAQVVILRQCRMIAHIRPIAGVVEDEVVRIPIRSADNLPLEHSGAFRIHIRGDAFGQVAHTFRRFIRNRVADALSVRHQREHPAHQLPAAVETHVPQTLAIAAASTVSFSCTLISGTKPHSIVPSRIVART